MRTSAPSSPNSPTAPWTPCSRTKGATRCSTRGWHRAGQGPENAMLYQLLFRWKNEADFDGIVGPSGTRVERAT
eukprot:9904511-Lingulodinium_polyedra.AAC.1